LAVAAAALPIKLGKAPGDKRANLRGELARATPAGQSAHQLLRIVAAQGPAPALQALAVHAKTTLQRHRLDSGVVEPAKEQLERRMPAILRHHLQQLGAIVHVQVRHRLPRRAIHAEDRIALVGPKHRL
jgi:hypothetical protein